MMPASRECDWFCRIQISDFREESGVDYVFRIKRLEFSEN